MSFFGEDKEEFKLLAGEDDASKKAAPKLPTRNSQSQIPPAPVVRTNRDVPKVRSVPSRPKPAVGSSLPVRVQPKANPQANPSTPQRNPLPERPRVEQPQPLEDKFERFDSFVDNNINRGEHKSEDYRNANLSTQDFEQVDVDDYDEVINYSETQYAEHETHSYPTQNREHETHSYPTQNREHERERSNDLDRGSFQVNRTSRDNQEDYNDQSQRNYNQGEYRDNRSSSDRGDSYRNDSYSEEPPRREKRPQPAYVDPYDAEEYDKPVAKAPEPKAPAKGKRGSNKKTAEKKVKGEKEPSRFFGERKKVLIIRTAAIASVLGIFGFGMYGVFSKPYIPSQTDVVSLITTEMNITKFDKDGGRAFVSAFAKEYFTFNGADNRNERLKAFAGEEIASILMSGANSDVEIKQAVTGEPYITSIRAYDDFNATYNIGTKINGKWMYSDIPVFYDPATKSYSITGTPVFTTPPSIIQNIAPSDENKVFEEADSELVTETEDNIKNFFAAWAKSDATTLGRYVTSEASVETKSGLRGSVIFKSLVNLEIEAKDPEDPTATTRKAVAVVEWANSAKPPVLTYQQTFVLELFQQPDGRWYVADITTDKPIYGIDNSKDLTGTEEIKK